MRAWVTTHQSTFLAIDTHAREVLRSHVWGLLVAAAWILLGWFIEAGESWVLLRLLGIDLPYSAVLAFEPVVSFTRSAAFFVPAGLGVQDGGYMAMLQGFGIPDATNRAAAFVLLKRFKEVFWIVVGWTLFFATRRSGPPAAVVSPDPGRSALPGAP